MTDRVLEKTKKKGMRWLLPVTIASCLLVMWVTLFLGGLKAVYAWAMLMALGVVLGPLNLLALLVYWARRHPVNSPFLVSVGLSLLATWPVLWGFGMLRIAYPSSLERSSPAATVRLPSDSRLMVIWGGDDLRHNYHAWFPSQRWSYDLTIEPAVLSSKLEDYGCYGTPVLAPTDGLVTHMTNDRPDLQPGARGDTRNVFGNVVVLQLETGTYLLLAHLQRNSVRVKAGDKVREGEVLAACGNSGNSTGPHIHIHHQRQDPMTTPGNLAEGLPLYFRDLDGAAMPKGGFERQGPHRVFIGDYVRHVR